MARKVSVTREAVLEAAVELVRREGAGALNARALAGRLGCSTQPLFRCFGSMDELRQAVLGRVHERYLACLDAHRSSDPAQEYKAAGLGYIAFAREEPEFFRLLFMRDRRGEAASPEEPDWAPAVAMAGARTGLGFAEAERFHLELWAFCHGVASMLATNYLPLDEESVERMLSDVFWGLNARKKEL